MSPAFPKTWDAGIRLVPQDEPEDCWAECCSGVLGSLGIKATQDNVRRRVLGGDVDYPLDARDVSRALALYGVTCMGPDLPLDPQRLLTEVTADPVRPVMVGYEWSPPRTSGHVALIVGWRTFTGRFLVQDPFFGAGELSYQEIAAAYGVGQWVVSFGRFAQVKS